MRLKASSQDLAPAHNKMKELISGAKGPVRIALTEDSGPALLADRIKVPCGETNMIGIGDMVMAAGLPLFVQQGKQLPAARRRQKTF